MTERTLYTNARLLDPASKLDAKGELLVEDGKIAALGRTLGRDGLAKDINPHVRGWITYYGRFYRSRLMVSLERVDDYLARWAMRKYKKLRGAATKAVKWLAEVRRRAPTLFAHWAVLTQPSAR